MIIKLLKDVQSIGLQQIPQGTYIDATVSKCRKYARFYYDDEVTTIGLVNFGSDKQFQSFEIEEINETTRNKMD